MKRFLIKQSFNFQKGKGKLMLQGMMYATEDPAEIAELESFAKQGSCEEIVGKPDAKAGAYPAEHAANTPKIAGKDEKPAEGVSDDDLSTVKGIGATAIEKLAEKGITTKSALAKALVDTDREDEMKEALGKQYSKVVSQFLSA